VTGRSNEDQAKTLDESSASQLTGIVDRLQQLVVDFGAPMRLLGFSFEESAALLGKWEKEGVNTETMLAGLKFGVKTLAGEGVKAADMGEALRTKIEAIGTSADPVGESIKTFGRRAGLDLAARSSRAGSRRRPRRLDRERHDTIAAATADTMTRDLWSQIFNTATVAVGEKPPGPRRLRLDHGQPAGDRARDGAFARSGGHRLAWRTSSHPGSGIQRLSSEVVPAFGGGIDWLDVNILPPCRASSLRGGGTPARAPARSRSSRADSTTGRSSPRSSAVAGFRRARWTASRPCSPSPVITKVADVASGRSGRRSC
jgi:hypothetical protein